LREFVTTITLAQLWSSKDEVPYKPKLVQIRLEVYADTGSWKGGWTFEGISAVIQAHHASPDNSGGSEKGSSPSYSTL